MAVNSLHHLGVMNSVLAGPCKTASIISNYHPQAYCLVCPLLLEVTGLVTGRHNCFKYLHLLRVPAIYCNWPKQGNESIKSFWVWSKLGSHFCFTEIKISVSGTIQLFFWIFFISTCLSGLCCYAVIVLVWRPWWEVLLAGVHCSAPVTISHCCITVEMLLIDISGLLYIWEQLLWNRTLRNISMLCWSNLCSTLLFRTTSVHSRQRGRSWKSVVSLNTFFVSICYQCWREATCFWVKGPSLKDMVKFSSNYSFSIKSEGQYSNAP